MDCESRARFRAHVLSTVDAVGNASGSAPRRSPDATLAKRFCLRDSGRPESLDVETLLQLYRLRKSWARL